MPFEPVFKSSSGFQPVLRQRPMPSVQPVTINTGPLEFLKRKLFATADVAQQATSPTSTLSGVIRGNPQEQGTIENIVRGVGSIATMVPGGGVPIMTEQAVKSGIETGNPLKPATDMLEMPFQAVKRQVTGEAQGMTRGQAWQQQPVEEALSLLIPFLAAKGVKSGLANRGANSRVPEIIRKAVEPEVVSEVAQKPIISETPQVPEIIRQAVEPSTPPVKKGQMPKASVEDVAQPKLTGKDYEGEIGNKSHITRTEKGVVPIGDVLALKGLSGENRAVQKNYTPESWEQFKQDIAKNGIKDPIFITKDYNGELMISEGNHRILAAKELGLKEVPVEVRYFGKSETQGTLGNRAGKISTEQPTATVQDAAVRPAQSTTKAKEPWEMTLKDYDTMYPRVAKESDGLIVGDEIPNESSISSSFNEYTIIKGVREIPMSELWDGAPPKFYSSSEHGRTIELARKIQESGRIDPIIVGYDADGLYVVEGGHRLDALKLLNKKSIPAKVVIDEEALFDAVKARLESGKPVPPEVLADYPDLAAKYGKQGGEPTYLGSTGDPNAISQFLTGTSPLNKAWEGVVDKGKAAIGKFVPEKLKQKLAYDSGRPEAWEAAKLARQQNIAGGIEETLGLAKAGKEQFTSDTHGKAYDYLDPTERMTAKPTDLTPEQSASLDRMRETQTKLTNEQVELGLLDKDVAEANASTYLRRFYDKHEKMDGFLASTFRKYRIRGTGKRYLETPEQRMEAGIKRDPFYAFAKSTAAQRHDIETGKLFAKVAESPEFKDLVGDKPKAGFAPKPIPNTWQYGKLRNKYVSQSIYDDIMEIARPWETSEMSQIYGKLLGVWKAGKTAWNPATHGRNIFSSAIQNDVIAGLSPSRVDKYVNAIQGMLKNEPELRRFKDLGGYEGTFNAAELQDFLGTIKTKRGSMMNRGLDYVLEHKLTSPLRAMSKAYQAEEIAFRYAAYKHRLSLGETPEMAMKVAKQAIPDYAQVPDLIRKARRSPVGLPFVSYAYKMLPAIAESAIKHPLRAGKYVALTYAMNEFAKSQMGISDEQYNQLRKSKNFNGGSQILLPFTDKAGDPVVMDLTYNLPWGDMLEWGAAAGGTFGQSEGGTGLMDKGLSMLNPLAKSAIEIGGNRNTYTGRDLTTQSMSNVDKSKAIGGQLLNTFAPTFPSRGIPNIIKAAMGEKDYYGKQRDLPTTLARNLAGISVSPINQQAEMQGRTMEFKKTLEDYQRRIYNAARKNDRDEVNRLVQEYSNYARTFGSN